MTSIGPQIHMVFASDTNQHGTIFGGRIMEWADEAGAVCARNFARHPVVTASLDRIDFLKPIVVGEEAHITPRLLCVYKTSMAIEVEIKAVNPFTGEERLTGKTHFTFVAIDPKTLTPTALPAWNGPETQEVADCRERYARRYEKAPILAPSDLPKTLKFLGSKPGKRVQDSVVDNYHLVMPGDHNSLGFLFAGRYLAWVDIAGAIAARRHCGHPVVTASIEKVEFGQRVPAASTVRLAAKVIFAAKHSVQVQVTGWLWNEQGPPDTKIADANLTFVARDPRSGRSAVVPQLLPATPEEEEAYRLGQWRYENQQKK